MDCLSVPSFEGRKGHQSMAIFYTSVDGKIYATGISIEEIESEVKILNFFLQDFDLKGTPKEQRLQARKAYNAMFAKDPENDEFMSWAPCNRLNDKSI